MTSMRTTVMIAPDAFTGLCHIIYSVQLGDSPVQSQSSSASLDKPCIHVAVAGTLCCASRILQPLAPRFGPARGRCRQSFGGTTKPKHGTRTQKMFGFGLGRGRFLEILIIFSISDTTAPAADLSVPAHNSPRHGACY